jgi:hypothetical protein
VFFSLTISFSQLDAALALPYKPTRNSGPPAAVSFWRPRNSRPANPSNKKRLLRKVP